MSSWLKSEGSEGLRYYRVFFNMQNADHFVLPTVWVHDPLRFLGEHAGAVRFICRVPWFDDTGMYYVVNPNREKMFLLQGQCQIDDELFEIGIISGQSFRHFLKTQNLSITYPYGPEDIGTCH